MISSTCMLFVCVCVLLQCLVWLVFCAHWMSFSQTIKACFKLHLALWTWSSHVQLYNESKMRSIALSQFGCKCKEKNRKMLLSMQQLLVSNYFCKRIVFHLIPQKSSTYLYFFFIYIRVKKKTFFPARYPVRIYNFLFLFFLHCK